MLSHLIKRGTDAWEFRRTKIPPSSHFHLKGKIFTEKVDVGHIFQAHVTIKPTGSAHFLRFNKEVAVFPPRFCIEKAPAQGTCKAALSCLERSNCWLQLQQGCTQNPLPCFQMAIWSPWLTPTNSHSTENIHIIHTCVYNVCSHTHTKTHTHLHTHTDLTQENNPT